MDIINHFNKMDIINRFKPPVQTKSTIKRSECGGILLPKEEHIAEPNDQLSPTTSSGTRGATPRKSRRSIGGLFSETEFTESVGEMGQEEQTLDEAIAELEIDILPSPEARDS